MKSKFFILALSGLVIITALLLAADHFSVASPLNREVLLAAAEPLESIVRLQDTLPPPGLNAHAFISARLRPDGQIEVLAEKNARQRWPIASLTKLFTAGVVLENHRPDDVVTLTQEDLPESPDSGFFRPGESFRVGDILVPLLLESSNNAAVILARLSNQPQFFIAQMNNWAQSLGLRDTMFFNPNGLDPARGNASSGTNYSSVYDLTLFSKWLIANRPEILVLTKMPGATIRQADGDFHHEARNTDELLATEPWSGDIVGGKTGFTDLAGKNLLLVLRAPNNSGYLINIVLGSPDHFLEMRRLVGWVLGAYRF